MQKASFKTPRLQNRKDSMDDMMHTRGKEERNGRKKKKSSPDMYISQNITMMNQPMRIRWAGQVEGMYDKKNV